MTQEDAATFLGSTEIELPNYMLPLRESEIEEIYKNGLKDVVIASGYNLQKKLLIYITEKKKILEIDLDSFFSEKFAILSARPIDFGRQIEVRIEEAIITVDSCDLIAASKHIDLSSFHIDMKHENHNP